MPLGDETAAESGTGRPHEQRTTNVKVGIIRCQQTEDLCPGTMASRDRSREGHAGEMNQP